MWLQVVRYIGLSAVDNLWTEHLTAIEDLREGINLRGFGQMDPLIEYKNEAFKLFENLMHNIDMEMVRGIMHVEMRTDEANPELLTKSKTQPMLLRAAGGVDPYKQSASAKSGDTAPIANAPNLHLPSEVPHSGNKIGRNDPCWCGSGKKWKKCHYPEMG